MNYKQIMELWDDLLDGIDDLDPETLKDHQVENMKDFMMMTERAVVDLGIQLIILEKESQKNRAA